MADEKSKSSKKAEDLFRDFGKKVDTFIDELNEAGEKLQGEFGDKLDDLKAAAQRLKKEARSKERWKEVEDGLKQAAEELRKAFKAAFQRRPGE